MLIALREYGVKEVNPGENPRIIQYSTDTGNTWVTSDDKVAWCSEYFNWVLLQVGIEGTHSARAASFFTWGETLTTPEFGCGVLYDFDGDGEIDHIAFYLSEDGDIIHYLGGNQSNMVNVQKCKKDRVVRYFAIPSTQTDDKLLLKRGSKSFEVKLLQKILGGLIVDGIFGPKTEQKVKDYQLSKGLTVDGTITLAELL